MNFLNVHPRYRPLASVLVSVACIAPIAMELITQQNADAQHKQATDQVEQAITRSSEQVARDERIALKRAERCILIDEKFPMVEGGNAFYNPRNRDSKRLLPANTALCSAQSGYTALVDEAGTVSSIKQAPIEKITPVLKQRGIQ